MSTYPLFIFLPLTLSHLMYTPLLVREHYPGVPLIAFTLTSSIITYTLFTHLNVLNYTSQRIATALTVGLLWLAPTVTITHVYTITQTNTTRLLLLTTVAMTLIWVYTPLPDITGAGGESGTYWGLSH